MHFSIHTADEIKRQRKGDLAKISGYISTKFLGLVEKTLEREQDEMIRILGTQETKQQNAAQFSHRLDPQFFQQLFF